MPALPASQVYEPGYPLLASLFVHLVPFDPFLVPNLLAVVAACWWFGTVARAVLGPAAPSREIGMAVFALTSLFNLRVADLWTTPWTTTPTVALGFGALAAGLSTLSRPRARAAFGAGLAGGLVAAFRPSDILFVLPPAALAVLFGVARSEAATRARLLASFGLGAGLGLGAAIGLHASVWGLHPSPYMILSAQVGFEWRLLPLQWVLLVDGPMPETAGRGIVPAFPFLILGLPALLVFALAGTRGGGMRAPHVVLCCYVLLAFAEFLAYRDLHPSGLWRYRNVYYFTWLFPIGGLYALLLCREVLAGSWRTGACTVALALLAFCWTPVLRRMPLQDATIVAAHRLMLPHGLPDVTDAVLLPLAHPASEMEVIGEDISAVSPERRWRSVFDLRAYPHGGNALLVPLRPVGGPLDVTTGPLLPLDTQAAPVLVRQTAAFRLPWPLWPRAASAELSPPMLPADGNIDFATADSARYLDAVWRPYGPAGRRLRRGDATVNVRVPHAGRFMLAVGASVAGRVAVRMHVTANGHVLKQDMTFKPPQTQATLILPETGRDLLLVFVADAAARRALIVRSISLTSVNSPNEVLER